MRGDRQLLYKKYPVLNQVTINCLYVVLKLYLLLMVEMVLLIYASLVLYT